jgi:hypothetical protein
VSSGDRPLLTLKWWIKLSIDSFMDARGGGTILWSSTLIAPVGILFRHWLMIRRDSRNS